jgi:hypothetical protein
MLSAEIHRCARKVGHSLRDENGVGVALSAHRLGYGLDYRGSIPYRGNDGTFSLSRRVQISSGGSYPGIKATGA